MRLIDADEVRAKEIINVTNRIHDNDGMVINHMDVIPLKNLDDAPTVDAVPVMRCRECERYKVGVCLNNDCALYGKSPPSDYLCAYGERREGDEHE